MINCKLCNGTGKVKPLQDINDFIKASCIINKINTTDFRTPQIGSKARMMVIRLLYFEKGKQMREIADMLGIKRTNGFYLLSRSQKLISSDEKFKTNYELLKEII